ncbi:MAG: hypothetical protein V4492_01160 [Chlamydiota bacterium]
MKVTSAIFTLLALLTTLAGCSQYYLSIAQQWVDVRYLASTHAKTPDPRQDHPPIGQMLVLDWRVPTEILKKKPRVLLDLIFWDYTTKTVEIPIRKRLDYATFKVLNEDYEKTGGILTYKAKIVTQDGEVFREWKHQLWVNLITLDQDTPTETVEKVELAE